MKSHYRFISSIVLFLGSLISIWFLMANLQKIEPALPAFFLLLVISFFLISKLYGLKILHKSKKYAHAAMSKKYSVGAVLLLITTLGLASRLFFRLRFTYDPVSDPMTFYNSAQALAAGSGQLGNSYVTFQPYLSAYNNLLGLSMRLVSDPWLATILLNTLFDVLSALAIYILLKKLLTPSSRLPIVAFGVWMLNPLNIIFSVLSLPVIVVNFFVILTILVSYVFIRQVKGLRSKNAFLVSALLGLTLGLGNIFRPIFVVPLIALTLTIFFIYLTTKRSTAFLRLSLSCLVLSSIIFATIQVLNASFVTNQTGLQAAKNPSGWSMYVGSSIETSGEWRPYHNDDMQMICDASLKAGDFGGCHDLLRAKAIERYRSYGVLKLAHLSIRKLYHQAELQSYFYNAEHSIVGYTSSKTYKIINVYMTLYMACLFTLSAMSLYSFANKSRNKNINSVVLFVSLVMVGWFMSFVLVESAPRYSTILYPIFIFLTMLGVGKAYNKKTTIE